MLSWFRQMRLVCVLKRPGTRSACARRQATTRYFRTSVFRFDHAVDIRPPEQWEDRGAGQAAWFGSAARRALYGVARKLPAIGWFVSSMTACRPISALPLATVPRIQQAVGEIEELIAVNARLTPFGGTRCRRQGAPSPAGSRADQVSSHGKCHLRCRKGAEITGNHGISATTRSSAIIATCSAAASTPAGRHGADRRGAARTRHLRSSNVTRRPPCQSNSSDTSEIPTRRKRSRVYGPGHRPQPYRGGCAQSMRTAASTGCLLAFHSTSPESILVGQYVTSITRNAEADDRAPAGFHGADACRTPAWRRSTT